MSPPGELDETQASSLILAHSLYYVKKSSSIKPEVHNVVRQGPQATSIENRVRLGHVVFRYASEQTGRQTYIHTWLRGTVVERRSLAGELSLSCARPVVDG